MLWQLTLNGIVSGAAYALMALGFALVYNTTKFFHFAHGAIFTIGAYSTFVLITNLKISILFSIPISIVVAAIIGSSLYFFIYSSIRKKGNSSLVLLLSSLGIYIIIQNLISAFLGDDIKTIRSGIVEEGINLLGARITTIQICIVIVCVVVFSIVLIFLKATKLGKAIRVISSNEWLARIAGINSERVILYTFAIGSGLAGLAGILVALDVDMTPTMGMNSLMMAVVVVIIGGSDSIQGIALGALFLGLAQNLGIWKLNSQWQSAIAFFILLLFLFIKPEGFLGKKIEKARM